MPSPGGNLAKPFAIAAFRLYWLAQVVSTLGDRVAAVALPSLVLELGGSARELSGLAALYSAVQLAFLLLGGVLVDRVSRLRVMVAADLARGLVLAGVVALLTQGRLEVAHLFVMYAILGVCLAFSMPAAASVTPQLVPRELLVSANAVRALSAELTGVLGPALAGLLIGFGGLALALGFNALSFALAMGLLALIRIAQTAAAPRRGPLWAEGLEGFRVIAGRQWLWVTIGLFALVNVFVAGSVSVLLPLLAREQFGGGPALGWLFSGLAAGSMLAALALGRLGRAGRRGLVAYGAVALGGAALGAMGWAGTPAAAVGLAAVLGASLTTFGVVWESTLQSSGPPEALGRVASVDMLGSFALLPLGFIAVGWLAQSLGAGPSLWVCGSSVLALALAGLAVPAVRKMR